MKIRVIVFVVCVALVALWCGCSGVSQQEYDDLVAENQKLLEQKESLNEHINTLNNTNVILESQLKDAKTEIYNTRKELERLKQIESEKESTTAVSDGTSSGSTEKNAYNDVKIQFSDKIKSSLELFDATVSLDMYENDKMFFDAYFCNPSYSEYNLVYAFVMLYEQDYEENAGLIIDAVEIAKTYVDKYAYDYNCRYFCVYVNDGFNNHIVTISNEYSFSDSDMPDKIFWESAVMRERYLAIEQSNLLSGCDYKIVNE